MQTSKIFDIEAELPTDIEKRMLAARMKAIDVRRKELNREAACIRERLKVLENE